MEGVQRSGLLERAVQNARFSLNEPHGNRARGRPAGCKRSGEGEARRSGPDCEGRAADAPPSLPPRPASPRDSSLSPLRRVPCTPPSFPLASPRRIASPHFRRSCHSAPSLSPVLPHISLRARSLTLVTPCTHLPIYTAIQPSRIRASSPPASFLPALPGQVLLLTCQGFELQVGPAGGRVVGDAAPAVGPFGRCEGRGAPRRASQSRGPERPGLT